MGGGRRAFEQLSGGMISNDDMHSEYQYLTSFSSKLVQVYPIGDEICATSELDDPHLKRKDHIIRIYIVKPINGRFA
jgi:hypothetical protein